MKKLFKKFSILSKKKKIAFICAFLMTVALFVTVPVYGWFHMQKKAAEMYKVEFPNSLYLNAAHREDRMYFNMNAISQYKVDPVTDSLAHDADGKLIPVTNQKYVFSVSGSNTTSYKLQIAHTNNNQFTYTLYEATQYKDSSEIPDGTLEENIVQYSMHTGSHSENDIVIVADPIAANDDETGMLYYVLGNPVPGRYVNNRSNDPMKADTSGTYYDENYESSANVQEDDIPSYWQSETISFSPDTNKKFCHYYIIIVTWEKRTQERTFESKETDMIYITAER